MFNQHFIKIFAAQKSVTVGGEHLKLFFSVHFGHFNNRDIKSAAAQIKDGDLAIGSAFLSKPKASAAASVR